MINYAPRVSMAFCDISNVINAWAETCEEMVVYEHPSDEEVNTTHVHIIMVNSKYTTSEQYKKIFYRLIKTDRKGNDLWSWIHKKYPTPDLSFITYMSEGKLIPSFIKKVSQESIDAYRALWVEPNSLIKSTIGTKEEKKKKENLSHWEICEAIKISILNRSKDRVTREASLTARYTFETIYDATIEYLRIHKVRTSRNELERFIVTIVRDDENFRDELRDGIKKNIFRHL